MNERIIFQNKLYRMKHIMLVVFLSLITEFVSQSYTSFISTHCTDKQ